MVAGQGRALPFDMLLLQRHKEIHVEAIVVLGHVISQLGRVLEGPNAFGTDHLVVLMDKHLILHLPYQNLFVDIY